MAKKKSDSTAALFRRLGLRENNPGVFNGTWSGGGKILHSVSPIDGKRLATVRLATAAEYERTIRAAQKAFASWRILPAPRRGEIVRQLGNALRTAKKDLGRLVTLETGKILAEGDGEVQEMVDICDFATGLSRQLYGLTIASERPQHRMMEQWHPLGIVGIISAFNFPVAVWSWNSALAAVCGNATVWKPSELTPLTALATTRLAEKICRANKIDPAIFQSRLRRSWHRQKIVRRPPRVARIRDRFDTHGQKSRCRRQPAARKKPARTRRQQRPHRRAQRESRSRHARNRFWCGGHRWTALHFHAPGICSRIHPAAVHATARHGIFANSHRQPAGAGHFDGTAHSRKGRGSDAKGDSTIAAGRAEKSFSAARSSAVRNFPADATSVRASRPRAAITKLSTKKLSPRSCI